MLRIVVLMVSFTLLHAAPGHATDLSPLYGYWSDVREKCSAGEITIHISAEGASFSESYCRVISSSRKGNRFVLKQHCSSETSSGTGTDVIHLLSKDKLKSGPVTYRRCPAPQ